MSENWNIQVSPKLPDGTLVNLRAEDANQMGSLLKYIEANAQAITSAIAVLTAAGNAANVGLTRPATSGFIQPAPTLPPNQQPPFSAQGGGNVQPAQSWGQPQQSQPPAPSCAHGPMKFRAAGTSAAGKAYSAFWSCTQPRGQQCPSQNAA